MRPAELRERRAALHLSQAKLGRVLGVARNTVARWERGELPIRHPELVALALDRLEGRAPVLADAACPTRGPAHNLPGELTSFIGREQELADLVRRLRNTRLMTLTGPGGVGKTRLAQRVAREVLAEYPGGVWFVDLAPLADPALLPRTVAAALGVREQPRQAVRATLAAALHDRHLLLVLDNCEHLVLACAELTAALLRGCSNVRLLATSREPLSVAGETVHRVPPLPAPDPRVPCPPDALVQYDAVRLLLERTAAAQSAGIADPQHARLLAEICWRLEGLPLALELAAARLPALGAALVATRLDDAFHLLVGGTRDAPPRQQTLRATLDWSYALLSAPEQRLLARLAVFAGGWTLEAAEGVCSGHGIERSDVVDLLARLVAKSLVLAEPGPGGAVRYRLLEPVRQYARERFESAGEGSVVRARHREWFLALAEQVADAVHGRREARELARLEVELDNLRAALEWPGADLTGRDRGLRVTGRLWWFWHTRARWREGRAHLQRLLAREGEASSPASRAEALHGAAQLAWAQGSGDLLAARSLHEEALAIRRGLGDRRALADSLSDLARTIRDQGDHLAACRLLDESLELYEAAGDGWGVARSLNALGLVAARQGDATRARRLYERSLALSRGLGDRSGMATEFGNLGRLAYEHGDLAQAASVTREALTLWHDLDGRWGLPGCLETLAGIAARYDHAERAARLFGAAEGLRDEIGLTRMTGTPCQHDAARVRTLLGPAAFAEAWATGRTLPVEHVIAEALSPEESLDADRQHPIAGACSALTPREREVAGLIARGLTNRQIAERLVIAERTVATHIEHILEKLGFGSRLQVGLWAAAQGLAL